MIAKAEQHEQEARIHACRSEAGLAAMYAWLCTRRDALNAKWPTAVGEELLQMQGEARVLAKQIRLIEQGPSIKPTERVST